MIPQRNLSLLANRLHKEHGGRRIPEAVLERDYCLAWFLVGMGQCRLGQILSPVLATGKVTSRKETLRLIARMSVPDAGRLLTQAWQRNGEHRDVRTAAVSAARQRLEDPASWSILDEAIGRDRPYALAALACPDPYSVAQLYRPAYGRLIARACLDPDEQVTVEAMGILPRWAAWTPDMSATLTTKSTTSRLWLPVYASSASITSPSNMAVPRYAVESSSALSIERCRSWANVAKSASVGSTSSSVHGRP